MKKAFATKSKVKKAVAQLNEAEATLESIRDHFNLEWGEDSHCDLDVALNHAIRSAAEAREELDKLLDRFHHGRIPLNWSKAG